MQLKILSWKRSISFARLPTKVHLVKAIVFPVVMYRELDQKEAWALKNWCFPTVVLEKTLESPFECKEIKPVNPQGKEINPEYLLERLMLKLQSFGHLMQRVDLLEKTLMVGKVKDRWRSRQQRMTWLDGVTDSINMNLSKLWKMVKDGEVWHAAVHGVARSWTRLNNWTEMIYITTTLLYTWN